MQSHEEIKSTLIYKVTEKTLPLMVWLAITMPLWLSPFHPAVASYLILGYFIYFLYKAIKMTYYGTVSLRLMNKAGRTNWKELISDIPETKNYEHYVMVVTATESATKVGHTLQALVDQTYGSSKINVVLAMEDRLEGSHERGEELLKKYAKKFKSMRTIFHVLTPEEVVGKASNASYAARRLSKFVKEDGLDPKNVIVTVCDADSLLNDQYISYLTYKYHHENNREYRFYAAPVLLYNNFWKLPFPVRMQMMLAAVGRISFLSQKDDFIQISTYSTSLWLIEGIGYWDVDIIPEDWHIWLQAFFTFGEKVRTIPLYVPIVRDGVLGPSLWKTLKTRYEQEKRWAWGATDVPYAVTRFFNSSHIDFWVKLRRLLFVTENHFMWPTAFFILTISASIPTLVNPSFERTVLGFLLPKLASFILTASSILLVLAVYFDYNLRKKVDINTSWKNVPMLFIQWYFLPIVSFAFSSLPALEAHTRMLIGKKLEYRVTEKVDV